MNILKIILFSVFSIISSEVFTQNSSDSALIWKFKTEKNNLVYIAGSLAFSNEKSEIPTKFQKAFDQADWIIFDENPDKLKYEFQRLYVEKGFYPAEESLEQDISQEFYVELEKRMEELNIPLGHMPRGKAWLVAHSFSQAEISLAGFQNTTLKDYFLQQAQISDKKVCSLQQIVSVPHILSNLNLDQQIDFLKYRLEISELRTEQIPFLYEAWKKGDLKELNKLYHKENQDLPKQFEEIFTKNTPDISELMKLIRSTDQNIFILMDSQHFLGEESVLESFEEFGVELERN